MSHNTNLKNSQAQCIEDLDTGELLELYLCYYIQPGYAAKMRDLLKVKTDIESERVQSVLSAYEERNLHGMPLDHYNLLKHLTGAGYDEEFLDWFAHICRPATAAEIDIEAVKKEIIRREQAKKTTTLFEKLQARKFDPQNLAPEKDPLLLLNNIPVLYAGNLFTLVGHDKSGKSHVEAAIAKAITEPCTRHLGFTSNVEQRRIAYIDCEQDRNDFESLLIRSGCDSEKVAGYHLTGLSASEAKAALLAIIEGEPDLVAVLIDGFADLASDVNSPDESNALVADLMAIADKHEVAIIGVLHLNPGSDEKSRGHLGSQLGRKSQTVLQVKVLSDGSRVMFTQRSRKQPIPEAQGVRFAWDKGMHTFVEVSGTPAELRQAEKVEEWTRTLQSVQAETGMLGWHYADLWKAIKTAESCSDRTAKSRIKQMLDSGLLKHNGATGDYTSTLQEVQNA